MSGGAVAPSTKRTGSGEQLPYSSRANASAVGRAAGSGSSPASNRRDQTALAPGRRAERVPAARVGRRRNTERRRPARESRPRPDHARRRPARRCGPAAASRRRSQGRHSPASRPSAARSHRPAGLRRDRPATACRRRSNTMLAGVMSPWLMPRACTSLNACASGAPIVTTSPADSRPRAASKRRQAATRGVVEDQHQPVVGRHDRSQRHDMVVLHRGEQRSLAPQRVALDRGRHGAAQPLQRDQLAPSPARAPATPRPTHRSRSARRRRSPGVKSRPRRHFSASPRPARSGCPQPRCRRGCRVV